MPSMSAISQQVAVCCGLPMMARQRASRMIACMVSAPSRKFIGTGMAPIRSAPRNTDRNVIPLGIETMQRSCLRRPAHASACAARRTCVSSSA